MGAAKALGAAKAAGAAKGGEGIVREAGGEGGGHGRLAAARVLNDRKLVWRGDGRGTAPARDAREMTGGRRRAEDLEDHKPLGFVPTPQDPPTPDEVGTLVALDWFKRSMSFRRSLQRLLRPLDVSFAEWRVLEAASRLIREKDAPVSHLEVSRELALGEDSVSRLMWQLSRRGLVSHDLDGLGLSYRVLLTDESERIVAAAYGLAMAAVNAR